MRIVLRIVLGLAAVLVLFVVALLLVPWFINMEPAKTRVVGALSQRTGVTLQAGKIEISFVPRPALTLSRGTLSGRVSGSFDALTIYPMILPLFRGEARIARLDIKSPNISMQMPERPKGVARFPHFSLQALEDEIAPIVSRALSRAPGLAVSVDKGRLTVFKGQEPAFRFSDIDGGFGLEENRAVITIACASNIWRGASLKMWLAPKGFKGQGRLELIQFQPAPLAHHFFPLMVPGIESMQGDFAVSFSIDGADVLAAEMEARVVHSTFLKDRESFVLQQVRVKGTFHRHGDKTTISVADFDSLYPALKMSGQLALDPASSRATADVYATYADVAGVRKACLFFAGQAPALQKVFDVLRGGRISGMNLGAHGDSPRTMMKKANIMARGNITEGRIVLPKSGLQLDAVAGYGVVEEGVLEGTNLAGRMGNSRATNGNLRLEMKEHGGLRLDMEVRADLAELPFSLQRLAPNTAFAGELSMVRSPRGTAEGRVIFDSLQKPVQTIVDVPYFSLHAGYDRFPYPIDVKGGRFHYDRAGRQIIVQSLSGKAGTSSFSDLSARLTFKQDPYLTIASGAARIVLQEVYPWLWSKEPIRRHLERIGPAEGAIRLSTVNLKGPVLHPRQWQFRGTGEVENITVQPVGFPGPIEARAGTFDARQDRISFSDLLARSLDASLAVSGEASHYLEKIDRIELDVQGEMGNKSAGYVSDVIHLPEDLRVRTPLLLSAAHLSWKAGNETSFSGDLKPQNGPLVSVKLLSRPGELMVKPLVLKDAESNMSLLFHSQKKEFDIAFEGSLTAASVDAFLSENRLLTGWMKGAFSARVIPGQPSASTARGSLEGAGLTIPRLAEGPLRIAAFHVKAEGNSAAVRSDFTTLGQTMSANGTVSATRGRFALHLDLSTDGLDLERIAGQMRGGKAHEALRGAPLEGTVRFTPRYVKYGKYLWKPVTADITFHPEGIHILIREADICGIDTPGRLEYDGEEWAGDFLLASKAQALLPAFVCLLNRKDFTGTFAVSGEVRVKGKTGGELAESLRGKTTFAAENGRIYRFVTLAKIFEIANLAVIYRIPDLMEKGFPYDSVEATLEIDHDKIIIDRGVFNGPSVNLIWKGSVDVIQKKLDVLVLVIPFTTIDRIIKAIPVVRYILAGRLLAIPVRVTGDLEQPTVTPLSPAAVGTELLDMAKRIFGLPLKIIESVLPPSSSTAGRP